MGEQQESMQVATLPVPGLELVQPTNLDENRLAEAQRIAAMIDAKDAQSVIAFGTRPQRELASATEHIIGSTRTRAAGDAGDTLTELLDTLKSADMDSFGGAFERFMAKVPVVGGFFDATKHLIQSYEPIANKISKIEAKLHQQQLTLLTDYENLNRLYVDNMEFIQLLEVYIAAGRLKIAELEAEVAQMEAAGDGADALKGQAVIDTRRAIDRMQQRLYDLEITRMVAIQTGPQIRLIQDGNERLATKIHTAVLTTIPLWKGQIALAINLANQKQALDSVTAVSDATNKMLVQNAQMLRSSTGEIQRQSERGVVDIETLQRTTDDLIATVEEAIRISREGRAKRIEGEKQLAVLEDKLRSSLTGAQSAPPLQGF